jgi:hypothetical protein
VSPSLLLLHQVREVEKSHPSEPSTQTPVHYKGTIEGIQRDLNNGMYPHKTVEHPAG